MTFDIKISV